MQPLIENQQLEASKAFAQLWKGAIGLLRCTGTLLDLLDLPGIVAIA